MLKKMMLCLVVVFVLPVLFAAPGYSFACICEGSLVVNGGGIDWLDKKGDSCGGNFIGGSKGRIVNDISDPFNYMSSKYYNNILRGTVESAYDPDSGWRCVKRDTY
jgi:hypothetical protein